MNSNIPLLPEDICPNTGKQHIPDWNTVTVDHDGGEAYLDVSCKDCGRSGCIGSLETVIKSINW